MQTPSKEKSIPDRKKSEQPRKNGFKNDGKPSERCRQLLTRAHDAAEAGLFSPWRNRSRFA